MIAVLLTVSSRLPGWSSLVLTLGMMAFIPLVLWIEKSPQRKRLAIALVCVVLVTGGAVVLGQIQCPDCFDGCCPDLIPYGICWPIGWPPFC